MQYSENPTSLVPWKLGLNTWYSYLFTCSGYEGTKAKIRLYFSTKSLIAWFPEYFLFTSSKEEDELNRLVLLL